MKTIVYSGELNSGIALDEVNGVEFAFEKGKPFEVPADFAARLTAGDGADFKISDNTKHES